MDNCDMKLRVPAELKAWIAERAVSNARSMNGEIVSILRNAMKAESFPASQRSSAE